MSFARRVLLVVMLAAMVMITGASAQEQVEGGSYSKGKGQFPNLFAPYTSRSVPKPNFTNSTRIDQLVRGGKLMLSMDDAIALALENNLDLAIARYNLSIADTEILRTKSGASTQGVSTGIVSGTPGGNAVSVTGASGSGAGGTTTGAGGAGTGTGGIVTSTLGAGPGTPSFDPVFTTGLNLEHGQFKQSNTVTTGVASLAQNTATVNFGYSQGFASGTTMNVGFNNQRQTTNNVRSALNPVLNTNMRFTVQQHLLQGLSLGTNRRFITIAKNNREISDVAFRQQVMSTVSQIQNIYWDLVNAYEDVKARQRAVDLANRLLSDNQKQVQIGTLAPIEVVRAQSEVAARTQDLIVSQTNLQLQQLLMKNAVTRNMNDPVLSAAEVIPVDTMQLPSAEPVVPIQDLVSDALSHRPELAQSYIDLTNRDITKKAARNALLPSLDLVAFYGTSGVEGTQNPFNDSIPAGLIPNTGYFDLFSSLFHNNFPDYAVGFNVNIPIRNRAAQATQIRSELEYRQAQMRLQQLQNQIRIEVRNAQFSVQQNRARVEAAQKGRQLAQESLDAEQKKYALGASTNYNVLQAQRDLANAESSMITSMAAYEKSRVALDSATGLTLSHLGIELSQAESGNVQKMPHVPSVVPNASVTAAPIQQTPPQPQQLTPPPQQQPK